MAARRPTLSASDERAEIEAIYRELEQRPQLNQCTSLAQCCQFRLTGRVPMLTLGEALYAARAVRASGRRSLPQRQDGACPLLDALGRCSIYRHRPFGCRTHFCQQAGGGYPRKKVADLIQRLDSLDETLGGNGPRALPSYLQDLLVGRSAPQKRRI